MSSVVILDTNLSSVSRNNTYICQFIRDQTLMIPPEQSTINVGAIVISPEMQIVRSFATLTFITVSIKSLR